MKREVEDIDGENPEFYEFLKEHDKELLGFDEEASHPYTSTSHLGTPRVINRHSPSSQFDTIKPFQNHSQWRRKNMNRKEDKKQEENSNQLEKKHEEKNIKHTKKNEDKKQEEKKDKKQEKNVNGKEDDHELPLMSLNHVSRLCKSVKDSVEFYTKVLGFVLIERPPALDFNGAWLFNYGIGIHLVQAKDENKLPNNHDLDPMDNHISFQCEDMGALVKKLKEMDIKFMKRTVGEEEDGVIDQLFFNDPDGFMIEICNCENIKLKPQGSTGRIKLPFGHNPPVELDSNTAKAS